MKNYEPRHIVLAIAISLFVLSPIVLLVLPTAVIGVSYHSPSQLVLYATSGSYLVYGAGLLFFCLSVLFIFLLWGRKFVIIVSLICLILSGSSFYIAAQHYIAMGTEGLKLLTAFSSVEHIYRWDEIETAVYYQDESEEVASTYEFTFHDGESIDLPENAHLHEYKIFINNFLKDAGIELEERFYE